MKKKIFGILLLSIFAVTTVSAVLVSYLSNSATVEVGVTSPMANSFSEDNETWVGNLGSVSVLGGETYEFYVKTENLAEATITGTSKNIVSNPDGLDCSDFSSVYLKSSSSKNGWWEGEVLTSCVVIDATTVEFIIGPQPNVYDPHQLDILQFAVTFQLNAMGTYTLDSKVMI